MKTPFHESEKIADKNVGLKRVPNGDVHDDIFLSPGGAAQVDVVEGPAVAFGKPGLPHGKGIVETQNHVVEIEPEAKA